MVLKTTDRIDTRGYTTEYDLFKLVPVKSKAEEALADAKKQVIEEAANKVGQTLENIGETLTGVVKNVLGVFGQN